MVDPKQSAEPHSQFPHIPAKSKIKPDPKCSGCPLVGQHPTCASFGPGQPATIAEQFDGNRVANWQWQVHRRQIDADGVPGSYNDGFTDSWKYYNARGGFNFADFSSWIVESVSGTTLTLKTPDGSDAGTVLLYWWRERDETGQKWVNGYRKTGCVQPGDVVQFSGNSVISYTCWPIITKIISCVGDTLVVQTDKAMTAALSKYEILNETTGEYEADTSDVTAKVWQHAANPATWRELIKPDYFFGKQTTLSIAASEIGDNLGIITLADTAVMHPGGFDPMHPTWTFLGKRIDTSEWETVPQADRRLFVLPDKSYVAFQLWAPVEATDAYAALSDDLTQTYSDFKITYFAKVTGDTPGCAVVGYSRCKWSVPVHGADGYTDKGYMCLKKTHDVRSEPYDTNDDGLDDTVDHSVEEPSGIDRYPDDGQCLQHGCCSHWEPAENADMRPFRMSLDAGNVMRELWGSCNQARVRLWPRDPSPGSRQLWRVGHPSLMWHAGYIGLQGPNIINFGELFFEQWRGQGKEYRLLDSGVK